MFDMFIATVKLSCRPIAPRLSRSAALCALLLVVAVILLGGILLVAPCSY